MTTISLTPVSSKICTIADTPIGERDKRPKVQVCLDFRKKEITRSKTKRTRKVLEVTIMWVKHLPKVNEQEPNPFVKLILNPGGTMHTTQLKTDRSEAQYIETFEFPVQSEDLKGYQLCVSVCNKKATRNAKCFGEVIVSLDKILLGSPVCQWFNLIQKRELSL